MIRGIERQRMFNDDQDRENVSERLSLLLPETVSFTVRIRQIVSIVSSGYPMNPFS